MTESFPDSDRERVEPVSSVSSRPPCATVLAGLPSGCARVEDLLSETGVSRLLLPTVTTQPWLVLLKLGPANAAETAAWEACLSADEFRRGERFRSEIDRRSFLTARAVLRRCLGTLQGVSPGAVRLGVNAYGKPELIGEQQVFFNLSHSEGAIALAFSTQSRIGVDLEHAIPQRAALDAAATSFAPSERAALANCPAGERHALFFRLWTLKEAYLKARGVGLSVALDGFEFDCSREQIRFRAPADDDAHWRFDQATVFGDYLWALAHDVSRGEPPMAPQLRLIE